MMKQEGARMRQFRFAKGDTIFTEGDPSDYAYLIWSGRVEVIRQTSQGPRRLAIVSKDEFLGEMGVIEDRARSASAIALEPTVCSAITKEEFVDMVLTRPQEAMDILRVLFDRLRTMNDELLNLQNKYGIEEEKKFDVEIAPKTAEMERLIPESGFKLTRLPYRIGRTPHNRTSALLVVNELVLPETTAFFISPNHIAIEQKGSQVIARDRGSKTGSLVNGEKIGAGSEKDFLPLPIGTTEITLGGAGSPYRFAATVS